MSAGKPTTRGRIVVIDDEPRIREMLEEVLRDAGYDVVTAPSGASVSRLQREQPADLVITDIFMPEQEGIETILELRATWPNLKIIAISGGGGDFTVNYLAAAEQLGATRSISKPFSVEQLLSAVRDVLAS